MSSVCTQCGSRSWRADRSLAGRLVCSRCGAPQGAGAMRPGRSSRGTRRFWRLPWWWWLVLLVAVALLMQLI